MSCCIKSNTGVSVNLRADVTAYTLDGKTYLTVELYLEHYSISLKSRYDNILTVDGSNSILANRNPIRYRGYYYSEALQLYALAARFYDPKIGRFICADTIDYLDPESPNGLNLFSYCHNNPVMYSDPSGHVAFLTMLGIIIGVAAVIALVTTVSGVSDYMMSEFSSMGAGAKCDLAAIRAGELWKTEHCTLAKNVRRQLRDARGCYKLPVVYSAEEPRRDAIRPNPAGGKPIIGSLGYFTATFGCYIAEYVIKHI